MYGLYMPPESFLKDEGCYRPLCPVGDDYVAGEIVNRWFHREHARRMKEMHETEMLKNDAELAELLFRRKQMLSRLGRNGQWSAWLKQQKISRSTADRLVGQYAESHGLADELLHRVITEPLQGNVILTARRVYKRLKNYLGTPASRMSFIRAVGDLFGLEVDCQDGPHSVRISIPPPVDESITSLVPSVVEIGADGTLKPIDYELRENGEMETL